MKHRQWRVALRARGRALWMGWRLIKIYSQVFAIKD